MVRAEAGVAGSTQFVYGERFALLRQWLVCLRVRVGAAVCPWAGLAVSGRQTGWQTHSLARPSLLQTLSKNPLYLIIIQKIKDIPLPPIPPPHPQSKWLYLGENWPWASRQAPRQIRSSSTDECTAFQPRFPTRFHSGPVL